MWNTNNSRKIIVEQLLVEEKTRVNLLRYNNDAKVFCATFYTRVASYLKLKKIKKDAIPFDKRIRRKKAFP